MRRSGVERAQEAESGANQRPFALRFAESPECGRLAGVALERAIERRLKRVADAFRHCRDAGVVWRGSCRASCMRQSAR
jgi:hypothetical protein